MRFLLYNIRYGTGGRMRPKMHWMSGYIGKTQRHLERIIDFIAPLSPDVIGLVEVDAGSYRSGKKNQAEVIAQSLGHYHVYKSKYDTRGRSLTQRVPVLNKQGNAFLCREELKNTHFHYFDRGVKRLIIELEMEDVTFFLVHLALSAKIRQKQLRDLYRLVKNHPKPHIVAGDFNVLWGEEEIDLFIAATGLENPNIKKLPTFPSWNPYRHLDIVLHSPDISPISFEVPQVPYSDHLPILFDFSMK